MKTCTGEQLPKIEQMTKIVMSDAALQVDLTWLVEAKHNHNTHVDIAAVRAILFPPLQTGRRYVVGDTL